MDDRVHVIDFETEPIEKRPHYPPKPVGVSVWHAEAEAPEYWAWGHPSGNNCTREQALAVLGPIWHQECLFHNGKFDVEVARVHLGLEPNPDPLKVHDTLFQLYLYDPNAESLSLKPSAERVLGLPPTEQQELQAFLRSKGLKDYDYAKAPGTLVAPYANGDTKRTRALYFKLLEHINRVGMLEAYRREQRLVPILMANEAEGIRINVNLLEADLKQYEQVFVNITNLLHMFIGPCNPDSSVELAQALMKTGRANEADFLRTPTGKLSTAKASMDIAIKDPVLRQILAYRGNLKTLLTTFMRPWLEIAHANQGRIHPEFNQVRGDNGYGTRTGRLSSSNPNFQNIPTEFKISPPPDFPALPFMRRYVLPDDGQVIVADDFNSQEFRIAAHFAEGRAAEIYRENPQADFHATVAQLLESEAGLVLDRKLVKITGFSLLYGSGVQSLSELLGVEKSVASRIRKMYFQVLPGLSELMDAVENRGRKGLPVKTWGNRLMFAEPPRLVQGRYLDFSYKLTNYLIQGSAADQTKECIGRLGYRTKGRRFMGTVHDEIVYSVDRDMLHEHVAEIKSVMEDPTGWDVPWRSKVEFGPNWWDMEEYK